MLLGIAVPNVKTIMYAENKKEDLVDERLPQGVR
jgi:hypothetical protein